MNINTQIISKLENDIKLLPEEERYLQECLEALEYPDYSRYYGVTTIGLYTFVFIIGLSVGLLF